MTQPKPRRGLLAVAACAGMVVGGVAATGATLSLAYDPDHAACVAAIDAGDQAIGSRDEFMGHAADVIGIYMATGSGQSASQARRGEALVNQVEEDSQAWEYLAQKCLGNN